MKSILSVSTVILAFGDFSISLAAKTDFEPIARDIAVLEQDKILDRVKSGTWISIPGLSAIKESEREKTKAAVGAVLEALKEEARTLPTERNHSDLVQRTLRAAAISKIAAAKGGYLNDLIAVSADKVFLFGAWTVLDRAPEFASNLRVAINERKKLDKPKQWLMRRFINDSDFDSKEKILESLRPDTDGYNAYKVLQKPPRDINDLPNVFDQMNNPEVALLWWTVYTTDYRVLVLKAGIAYVEKGGRFTENVNNFRAKCTDIFGKDGLPFFHELKDGRIYPESIWREWNAAKNAEMRNRQISQWF